MSLSWVLLIHAIAWQLAAATYGVDVSTAVSESDFRCLKDNGYHYAIVRSWESLGRPDENAPATVKNAWNAGLAHVDVYMFPCYACGDPKGQVKKAVEFLHSHSVKHGMFWFDIEGAEYWSREKSKNVAFMKDLLDEANAQGQKIGIYTSASQWEPIMGDSTIGSKYPLWYAHYDGSPSFSDFQPFGGWHHPSIKQFQGTTYVCGVGIDKDWYP